MKIAVVWMSTRSRREVALRALFVGSALAALLAGVARPSYAHDSDLDASVDGGEDGSVDGGEDGSVDGGEDGSVDGGEDGSVDAEAEGGRDAAARDAGPPTSSSSSSSSGSSAAGRVRDAARQPIDEELGPFDEGVLEGGAVGCDLGAGTASGAAGVGVVAVMLVALRRRRRSR